MNVATLRHGQWFERIYKVGIGIKGFDGAVELVTGILLLVAPGIVHGMLSAIIGYAQHHSGLTYAFIAEHIARLDNDLAKSGLAFLIIFLIGHGVVKIVLVYCLLRRILRAYPYALCVLVLFLVYQLYVLVQDPLSIGMWVFTLLDIAIIWLVWGEYTDLRKAITVKGTRS
ncbi:DUF2127 domain-containing protein [Candidatus Saccharibacteria bacterium]|nr:DUF2127 domain-containing protein [Candidatus Saccharibacteria bacterium]